MRLVAVPLAIVLLLVGGHARTRAERPRATGPAVGAHALSMYGDLKYGPNFKHFGYANPRAPKGGQARLAAVGTFDTFNPFILKGVPAAAIGGTFDTLMLQSDDEPFSEYGLIAETIETPADRSWVTFTLRREARFHDGSPITADDVIWTFETLKRQGHPFYRSYYANVASEERLRARPARITF